MALAREGRVFPLLGCVTILTRLTEVAAMPCVQIDGAVTIKTARVEVFILSINMALLTRHLPMLSFQLEFKRLMTLTSE